MRDPFSWGLQPHPRSFGYIFRAQLLEGGLVHHVATVIRPGLVAGLRRDKVRARVFADSLPRHPTPPRMEEIT